MKKRIMMFSSVTALVTLLVAGGTMAWFTSNPEAVNNEFEAGTVNIGINENRFQNIKNWNPGQTSTKDVDITIDSSKQTYVRVKLIPSWGSDLALDHVALNFADVNKWVFEDGTKPNPTISIKDKRLSGYIYYTDIVNKDNKSINLLQSVKFLESATNDYQGKKFTLKVVTEGTQASYEAYKSTWGLQKLPDGVKVWQAPTP